MKAVFPPFVCHRQAVLPSGQLRAPSGFASARTASRKGWVQLAIYARRQSAAQLQRQLPTGFDTAGRLARMSYGNSSAFQFYDLNGQRIFKTDSQSDANFDSQNPAGSLNPSTAGVFYQYDQNGNLLWQQTVGPASTGLLPNEAATHYYWLPNEHGDILIGFDQGINSYAVYTDHLNTPRLVTKIEIPQNPRDITDTANDLPEIYGYGQPQGISPLAIPVWQWSYSPFGADLANGYEAKPTTIGNNFKPDLWTWTGLPETGGADPNQVAQETWRIQANLSTPPTLNIRYPRQYYDFEVGLVQNWWRTYEPRIGRYSSADPIGLNGGFNRFGYAYQDGINNIDPMGLIAPPQSPNTGTSENSRGPNTCSGRNCVTPPWWPWDKDNIKPGPRPNLPQKNTSPKVKDGKDPEFCSKYQPTYQTCVACCTRNNAIQGSACREQCSHRDPSYPDSPFQTDNGGGQCFAMINYIMD